MRALGIYVYRNKLFSGCSNGGIAEKYDELLLICDEGNVEIDENNLPENLVKMVSRKLCGGEYKHIEPFAPAEHLGWMSGGSVAGCSDGRFCRMSQYPLSVHDRQETQEQYNRLSR
ncbi:MAG: hypothetical protein RR162_00425 [Oscillospiraceae bacterium]